MNINQYVRDKIYSSTSIRNIINNNIFPDISDYKNIPCIVYKTISQNSNLNFRRQTISIKGIQTSQDNCENLNNYIYSLFDGTTNRIYEKVQDLKVESINIINNLPSVYDNENKIWFSITDIRINYIK